MLPIYLKGIVMASLLSNFVDQKKLAALIDSRKKYKKALLNKVRSEVESSLKKQLRTDKAYLDFTHANKLHIDQMVQNLYAQYYSKIDRQIENLKSLQQPAEV